MKSSLSTQVKPLESNSEKSSATPRSTQKNESKPAAVSAFSHQKSNEASMNDELMREFRIMDREANVKHRFVGNSVSTSKYSIWSFVPKSLFEQFRRVANVYFLIISALQVGTDLSPTSKFATIVPLMGVIVLTMIKEAIEDFRRHKADKQINMSVARIVNVSTGRIASVLWSEIQVGDILELTDKSAICADGILLSSCTAQGLAYIETSSLDGETNLKIRQALPSTRHMREPEELATIRGSVHCELPNPNIYRFQGSMQLDQDSKNIPVSNINVVLRGSFLRNTKKAYVIVVFTGSDTKQIRNTRQTPSKRSNVDRLINRTIFLVFLTLIVMCLISTIFFSIWVNRNTGGSTIWYLPFIGKSSQTDTIFSFITFLILFNNLVPISLYVSLEIVKLMQAKLIASDILMYHDQTQTPALARTSNLNEDLGQIDYVFSDKTGTLTRNEMIYRRMSIGGIVYDAVQQSSATEVPEESTSQLSMHATPIEVETIKSGRRLIKALKKKRGKHVAQIRLMLRIMSVCHTVIPEKIVSKGRTITQLQAASPDEEALVNGAKEYGFEMDSRDESRIVIKSEGSMHEFKILNINEFTSSRKCMSMIVRTPEGSLELYVKGADDVIFDNLQSGSDQLIKNLTHHLSFFGVHGLRTLVFAKADLDEEVYADWNERFEKAHLLIKNKENVLASLAREIETNLELVGATAIEDRLQDGVPEAIEMLGRAGMKVWVLTGDKVETAINIGLSCNLISLDMKLMQIEVENEERIDEVLTTYTASMADIGLKKVSAVIVDGASLALILDNKTRTKTFFTLCCQCQSVIACRVSPRQKAAVVAMIKRFVRPEPMTLAIGDGANDVSMIQEAHIGIGISGNEGMQAVRSSDYAIAQFRYLQRLLLVHGNWNYRRVTTVILYSFYKNIANVLTLFYYCIFNGFSGTSIYESWLSAGWNVGWTFWPIIMFGITDKDLHSATITRFPEVYMRGQKCLLFNLKVMMIWVSNAIVHSGIVFTLTISILANEISSSSGHTHDLWSMGTVINGCMVILVNFRIALESQHWTKFHLVSILGSVFFWFCFVIMYSFMISVSFDFYQVGPNLLARPVSWLTFILVPLGAIIYDLSIGYIRRMYFPDPIVIASELQRLDGLYDVQKSHSSDILDNVVTSTHPSGSIGSNFAFSSPTYESAAVNHGVKDYDGSKQSKRSGGNTKKRDDKRYEPGTQVKNVASHKDREEKSKSKKSKKKSGSKKSKDSKKSKSKKAERD